jgi:hypothetical protein
LAQLQDRLPSLVLDSRDDPQVAAELERVSSEIGRLHVAKERLQLAALTRGEHTDAR